MVGEGVPVLLSASVPMSAPSVPKTATEAPSGVAVDGSDDEAEELPLLEQAMAESMN